MDKDEYRRAGLLGGEDVQRFVGMPAIRHGQAGRKLGPGLRAVVGVFFQKRQAVGYRRAGVIQMVEFRCAIAQRVVVGRGGDQGSGPGSLWGGSSAEHTQELTAL